MNAITKETAIHFLSSVPEDRKFWAKDGAVFANYEDLEKGLKKMKSDAYKFHANKDKNDFSAWIYDVIGDVDLADSLRNIKTSKTAAEKVKARISRLKRIK